VAQVCRRLDGIPLALEMAAVRLRGLSLEQLADRLDQRLRLLTGGSRTALPRQQTLQATVDWSYRLLTPEEQALFARLSVFARGFTLEAAEAVCAGGVIAAADVLDLLVRLVEKSLVVADDGEAVSARYRLLETLRQYGPERLVASEEAATVHCNHAAYFLALAEQAGRAWHGPEQVAWLGRLEREHDNLRAALVWCLDPPNSTPQRANAALRIAGALWWFWDLHPYPHVGRHWLEQALTRNLAGEGADNQEVARARAKSLQGAGWITAHLGDTTRGQQLMAESLALFEEIGD
jgi:non-specific serine/threonine protein kinase